MSATSDIVLNDVHETAFFASILRAGHYLYAEEPKIFADSFAHILLEKTPEEIKAFYGRMSGAHASTCVLRSRFAEDRLEIAHKRGVNQYVVLGAGLDSYALRKGDDLGSLIVFEVDDPPFQAWKRRRIAELGIHEPKQVRYAPCDFETMSVEKALDEQGFAKDEPSFISWLGVTQYLTRDAIRATLRWAGSLPKGSEINLTISEPGALRARDESAGPKNIVDFTSYISMEEMTEMLHEARFSEVIPFTYEEASEFCKDRTDGLVAPEFLRSVAAIV
jgi:methyltransferase (TIGR00027 family)